MQALGVIPPFFVKYTLIAILLGMVCGDDIFLYVTIAPFVTTMGTFCLVVYFVLNFEEVRKMSTEVKIWL